MLEDDDEIFAYRGFIFGEDGLTVDDKLQELYADTVDEATGESLEGLRSEHQRAKNVREKYPIHTSDTRSVLEDYLATNTDLMKRMRTYLDCYLQHLRADRERHHRVDLREYTRGLEAQIHAINLKLFYLRRGGERMRQRLCDEDTGSYVGMTLWGTGRCDFDEYLAVETLVNLSCTASTSIQVGNLGQTFVLPRIRQREHEEEIASKVHPHYDHVDSTHQATQSEDQNHHWCPITRSFWHVGFLRAVQLVPTCWGTSNAAHIFDLPASAGPDVLWDWQNHVIMHSSLAVLLKERLATLVPSRVRYGIQEYKFVILDENILSHPIQVSKYKQIRYHELHGRELVWRNLNRPKARNVCMHWLTCLEARRYSRLPGSDTCDDTTFSCNGKTYPQWLAWPGSPRLVSTTFMREWSWLCCTLAGDTKAWLDCIDEGQKNTPEDSDIEAGLANVTLNEQDEKWPSPAEVAKARAAARVVYYHTILTQADRVWDP